MTWRGRRSILARGLVVLAAGATGVLAGPAARAQPAADLASAKDLYLAAEAAVRDGRFDDAIRDYGAAYERSRDPALLYKLGRAHERAGRCQAALGYYARYVRDGKPSAQFAALTRERIAACGGDPASVDAASAPAGSTGSAKAGSGADAAPAGGAAPGAAAVPGGAAPGAAPIPGGAAPGAAPVPGGAAIAPGGPGREAPRTAAQAGATHPAQQATAAPATGSTAPAPGDPLPGNSPVDSPPPRLIPSTSHKIAWLLGGSTIALATLGGVLAYATNSAENDVRDLYAGFAGRTPSYDAQTQKRYRELVDEGRRYERLSWTAFGLAGATAIGAAVLFVLGGSGGEAATAPARVVPQVTARSAGVAVQF